MTDKKEKILHGMGYGIYHAVLGVTLLPASLIAGLLDYNSILEHAPKPNVSSPVAGIFFF